MLTNPVCTFSLFFRTKALVLELLAAVCLVRGGHEIILSAFDNFKEVRSARTDKPRQAREFPSVCAVSKHDSAPEESSFSIFLAASERIASRKLALRLQLRSSG